MNVKITTTVTNTLTLKDIKKLIEEGRGPEILKPFDELLIPLGNDKQLSIICGHVDEQMARFVFKKAWCEAPMNRNANNLTGYYGSDGRKTVLEDIFPQLPPELREMIRPRRLLETIDGKEVRYEDPLWLLSATDVFGPLSMCLVEPDSFQLPIFKRQQARKLAVWWWLRSTFCYYAYSFLITGTGGNIATSGANNSGGLLSGLDL